MSTQVEQGVIDEMRMKAIQSFGRDALKNGGITHVWIGSKFYALSVDAVDIEVILKRSLEKDNLTRFARNLIGNGLIFAPETVLGLKLDLNGTKEKQLMESFNMTFKLVTARMAEPWLQLDALYKLLPYQRTFEKNKEILRRFVNEIIKEKRKQIKDNIKIDTGDTKSIKSFLELHIVSSGVDGRFSDEELLEESLVILLAATNTSAVGFHIALKNLFGAVNTCSILVQLPQNMIPYLKSESTYP
ncbi:unnamed protein product [Arctia plantaginis]|uniref:Cytochrome P450 n=1 Tax=Arctia plantaginis TaxID=874455 RepID=A0A8S1BPG8_ARCPL|nr:unnamed protein product [Arctia plantaginis]